jgi:hypothetical protein
VSLQLQLVSILCNAFVMVRSLFCLCIPAYLLVGSFIAGINSENRGECFGVLELFLFLILIVKALEDHLVKVDGFPTLLENRVVTEGSCLEAKDGHASDERSSKFTVEGFRSLNLICIMNLVVMQDIGENQQLSRAGQQ